MEFKKLTLQDIEIVRPFFCRSAYRSCDFTVGGLFLWRHVWHPEFAIEDGVFYSRLYDKDGGLYYNLPLGMGGDAACGVVRLRDLCRAQGLPLRLCPVPAPVLSLFPGARVTPHRELADYLYNVEDIATLRGKKLAGQRNHVNAFNRIYPDALLEEITPQNLGEVRAFFEEYCPPRDTRGAEEDHAATADLLRAPAAYGLRGSALRAAGRIVGFSFGEVVGDTLFVHVEKADRAVRGAHQALMSRFVAATREKDTLYINREDDAGDEGLRTAKMALHPCALIEKYTVELPPF